MPFRPPMGDRPPLVRELISAGGTLPAGVDMALVTAAGQNVIESMSGHIFHFLLSQRQNHKLSGHAVSRTHLKLPPLDLTYEMEFGREMLTIECVVAPEMLAAAAPPPALCWGRFRQPWPNAPALRDRPKSCVACMIPMRTCSVTRPPAWPTPRRMCS